MIVLIGLRTGGSNEERKRKKKKTFTQMKQSTMKMLCINYYYMKKFKKIKANETAGYGTHYHDGRTMMDLSILSHTGDKLNRSSSVP